MRKFGLIGLLALGLCLLSGTSAYAAASYTVKSGDCLWTIANKTGTSVATIKQLNNLNSDLLQIGQVLVLSTANTTAPPAEPAPAPAPAPAAAPAPAPSGTSIYIVQSGDNLWTISQRYGTTVANIMALNSLSSDRLQVGDQLVVSGTAPNPVAAPAVSRSGDSVTGSRIIEKASKYLGTPYVYGGSSPSGFDCSGFTQYIYKQFGISLYRTAASQYGNGVQVSKSQLIAGDLVFFKCGGSTINHVGIYCGNGQFIHSSSPSSGGVIYSSLTSGYYANTYVGARRIVR